MQGYTTQTTDFQPLGTRLYILPYKSGRPVTSLALRRYASQDKPFLRQDKLLPAQTAPTARHLARVAQRHGES